MVASQPRPSGRITADKREIKDFPQIIFCLCVFARRQVGNFVYPQNVICIKFKNWDDGAKKL
jgi:hypothetical protein